jgi:hypothetical protein
LGWNQTSITVNPVARIAFGKAITIDDAMNALWDWRRFFVQIAFEELLPTAISARHRSAKRGYYADFYLPNLLRSGQHEHSPHSFHPADVPLNRWKDRNKLSHLMQAWLEKSKERRVFRIFLDHVIARRNRRSSIEDVVSLCSGIDSLKEILAPSTLTKKDIDVLSKAAIAAAVEHEIDVAHPRIRNILGNLRGSSLRLKMESILSKAVPSLSDVEQKTLIDAGLQLRQMAAHGTATSEMTSPFTSPVVEALTAACVLYDVRSTGFLDDAARLGARSHFRDAMGRIMQLKQRSP